MNRKSFIVEDRLDRYRPTLEAAIERRIAGAEAGVHEPGLVELDWNDATGQQSNHSRVLVVAAAVVLIGGLGAVLYHGDTPMSPASPTDSAPATSNGPVVDTAVVEPIPGATTTPRCPAGTDTVGVGTLYLGGAASEQNLAADGFIFSLPAGTEPAVVALKAIATSVIGLDCSITAVPPTGAGTVLVLVDPPAVPTSLRILIQVNKLDGVIGVTRIHTAKTTFEIDTSNALPVLKMTLNRAPSAVRAQVRFKKGDDVWELTTNATDGTDVALDVPTGETDRFPDEPVEWVLFTLLDANDRVVGVGGGVT